MIFKKIKRIIRLALLILRVGLVVYMTDLSLVLLCAQRDGNGWVFLVMATVGAYLTSLEIVDEYFMIKHWGFFYDCKDNK